MWTYATRRLLLAIPTLVGVTLVTFVLVALSPGDPALAMLGDHYTEDQYLAVRAELGLDDPLPVRYGRWASRVARGDLGRSNLTKREVVEDLAERWPATAELAATAMVLAALVGILAGLASASWRGTLLDQAAMGGALAGVSLPIFWLAGILLVLATRFVPEWPDGKRLPVDVLFTGETGFLLLDTLLARRGDLFLVAAWHLVLPAIALGTIPMAIISRMTRSSMLETLSQDYVRTARAKGLTGWRVSARHALRNALIPVVTVIGLQFGALLGGAIITETVFNWPGVGTWILKGVETRDQNVIQAGVLVIACGFTFINLGVDLLYGLIDPRIRHG